MNKEKIRNLISFIEKSNSFSMHSPYWHRYNRDLYKGKIENTEEGCPACILGHLRVMEGYEASDGGFTVTHFLDMPSENAARMVCPKSHEANYQAVPGDRGYIDKRMALEMLETFVDTGEVEWGDNRP